MRKPIDVLNNLQHKATQKDYKFQRLYRNLYNPEFYLLAYQKIATSQGSMTPGADGKTLDNMSMERINLIIERLKNHTYQPNPARRTYIAKKNSNKKRPLGIPSTDDRLIQEVVRMILEAIYEPTFSSYSHGFRPNRSCHTALLEVQSIFHGAKWIVEGDIKACFDSFDHHVLTDILKERIEDEQFISLMWKFLKAGYMEQWEYHATHSGAPQGSGMSPILANIYMSKLDNFIEQYKMKFNIWNGYRKPSAEYQKVHRKYLYWKQRYSDLREMGRLEESKAALITMKEVRKIMFQTYGHDPFDEEHKSLQYNRYADDFIIGIIGSKEDAEKLKEEIALFLQEKLKLTLSMEKTKVTHSSNEFRYLGYDISVSRDNDVMRDKNGTLKRMWYGAVRLRMPHEKWQAKLQEYKAFIITNDEHGNEQWRAMPRGYLINMTDVEILRKYNSEISGLYNYYRLAINVSTLNKFHHIMEYSMLKTFGMKYRASVTELKKRYKKNGRFGVDYDTKAGKKRCDFYHDGFRQNKKPAQDFVDLLPQYKNRYANHPNTLANRIKAGVCEICGKENIEIYMHHVKSIKELTGKNVYEQKMLQIRRKSLALCDECFSKCCNKED